LDITYKLIIRQVSIIVYVGFRWKDNYGQDNVSLKEYTDGSLREAIFIDDGTNLGKQMGEFNGYK